MCTKLILRLCLEFYQPHSLEASSHFFRNGGRRTCLLTLVKQICLTSGPTKVLMTAIVKCGLIYVVYYSLEPTTYEGFVLDVIIPKVSVHNLSVILNNSSVTNSIRLTYILYHFALFQEINLTEFNIKW